MCQDGSLHTIQVADHPDAAGHLHVQVRPAPVKAICSHPTFLVPCHCVAVAAQRIGSGSFGQSALLQFVSVGKQSSALQ